MKRFFRAVRSRSRVLLLVFTAVAAGCQTGPRRPPDIILIVVDALRADHVPPNTAAAGLTPFLDSMVGKATVFRAAHAQSSWTNPSVASLLTSRYPSQHGVVTFKSRLGAQEVTLAKLLRRAGYRTAAFSGNVLLSHASGFDQGFDEFRNVRDKLRPNDAKPRAAAIDDAALEWLQTLSKQGEPRPPFFVYLHYMETHSPYEPDAPWLEKTLVTRGRSSEQRAQLEDLFFHPEQLSARDAADRREDLYTAQLAGLDDELGKFISALEKGGFLDHAIVILTADHGEEFLEHGRLGHGHSLYEEVLRVPLLIWAFPDHGNGSQVTETVSSIDIAPTIAAAAGLQPEPSFEGRSLLSCLPMSRGAVLARRFWGLFGWNCSLSATSVAELIHVPQDELPGPHQERSIVRGSAKLIQLSDGELQSFDLGGGALEANRSLSPEATNDLRVLLSQQIRKNESGASKPEEHPTFDVETRDALRALGYSVDK